MDTKLMALLIGKSMSLANRNNELIALVITIDIRGVLTAFELAQIAFAISAASGKSVYYDCLRMRIVEVSYKVLLRRTCRSRW